MSIKAIKNLHMHKKGAERPRSAPILSIGSAKRERSAVACRRVQQISGSRAASLAVQQFSKLFAHPLTSNLTILCLI